MCPPFYFELQAGESKQESIDNYGHSVKSTDVSGNLTLGYDFKYSTNAPFRFELSYAYKPSYDYVISSSNEEGTVTLTRTVTSFMNALMANMYVDFFKNSTFSPYITAGFGSALTSTVMKDNRTTGQKTSVSKVGGQLNLQKAWNAGAGVNITLNPNWKVDLGAKYMQTGKVYLEDEKYIWKNMDSIDLMIGMRYNF